MTNPLRTIMKKLFLLFVAISACFLTSCDKEFFVSEENDIVGVWKTPSWETTEGQEYELLIFYRDGMFSDVWVSENRYDKWVSDAYWGTYTWNAYDLRAIIRSNANLKWSQEYQFSSMSNNSATTVDGMRLTRIGTPNKSYTSKIVGKWICNRNSQKITLNIKSNGHLTLSDTRRGIYNRDFSYIYDSGAKLLLYSPDLVELYDGFCIQSINNNRFETGTGDIFVRDGF